MSNSSVSGPYASAVSIKFAPSSTARCKTLCAFSRSGGQPQIPSPVKRIAPNPSRLTGKSPPMLKLELSFADAAAKSVADLPAKSDAPLASVARRNRRRLMPLRIRLWFVEEPSSVMARNVCSDGIFSRTKLGSGQHASAQLDRKPICRRQRLRLQPPLTIQRRNRFGDAAALVVVQAAAEVFRKSRGGRCHVRGAFYRSRPAASKSQHSRRA